MMLEKLAGRLGSFQRHSMKSFASCKPLLTPGPELRGALKVYSVAFASTEVLFGMNLAYHKVISSCLEKKKAK